LTIMALAMRMATHAGGLPGPDKAGARRRRRGERHGDREPDHDRDDRRRRRPRTD